VASTIGFVVSYCISPHCCYIIKSRLAILSPDEFLVSFCEKNQLIGALKIKINDSAYLFEQETHQDSGVGDEIAKRDLMI